MPGQAVATARMGDVTPTPGTTGVFPTPAVAGTWAPGPVILSPYARLTVQGNAAIWSASCVFTLTMATDSSGNPVAPVPTSTVTLSASTTVLQKGENHVLRRDDTATDSYGNKLEATPGSALLLSA